MVTPWCCCWYRAKATEKNGASNVEPAPVRAPGWPTGMALAVASAAAELPVVLVELPLLHAPRASRMIATAAAVTGHGT